MKITIAHSPDSDDAFMFYALAKNKINTLNYEFKHVLCDIQTLSAASIDEQKYDVSAISFHAFVYADQYYDLMTCGASMGDNYGPTLITNETESKNTKQLLERIKEGKVEVAVPGLLTSAYLSLKLYAPDAKVKALNFDDIQPAIKKGDFEAGLIIHEGQLNYAKNGFCKLVNLGEWWFEKTNGLPLPLGANIIRKSLSPQVKSDLNELLKQSIEYSLNNKEEALNYALQFGRDLDKQEAAQFVGMYVNELTLDLGQRGKDSVNVFFKEAFDLGLIPRLPKFEFVI
jgi:1,4-dihydroxy-6-naphthoate synthase